MDFVSPAQRACYERVAGFLRELYGERLLVDTTAPSFGLRSGSAWINVWVRPGPSTGPVVTIRAWLVTGTDPTPDFLHHLLSEPARPVFGAYGLDASGDVYLEHSLLGEGVTLDQVRASVESVAAEADRADDRIVARFGGIRMTDQRV